MIVKRSSRPARICTRISDCEYRVLSVVPAIPLCCVALIPHILTLSRGHIGLTAFRSIMRDPLMSGIPLILETPADDNPLEAGELSLWQREIKLLYEIQSISDAEWPEKKVEIEARWRAERDVLNPPKEKKVKGPKPKAVKEAKAPKGKKGKATKKDEEVDDEGCESHAESD